MEGLFSLITFCLVVYHYGKITATFIDPDTYRNVRELITSKGYPLEEHTIQTSDGYILSMQRIPHGRNNQTDTGDKEVVLFFHGEIGDSKAWFLNPPSQGLGYILADAGYDVWMVNNRGSALSKKHAWLPTHSLRYWKFSFDELARYDSPAAIDYTLKVTGKEALHIIGYSRGNTVGFALLSELPQYNKKVKLFVALGPVAFVGNMGSALRYAIPFRHPIAAAVTPVTKGEFLPDSKALRIFTAKFCEAAQDLDICQNLIFAIAGHNRPQLNQTRVPIYTAQYPSSTSVRSLLHWAQLYLSKRFRKYDNGPIGNLAAYKQLQPPDYKLSQITAPTALFWSKNDKIATTEDVSILRRQLKSVVDDYSVPDQYNHFDFIWAINSPELVYTRVLELIAKYK